MEIIPELISLQAISLRSLCAKKSTNSGTANEITSAFPQIDTHLPSSEQKSVGSSSIGKDQLLRRPRTATTTEVASDANTNTSSNRSNDSHGVGLNHLRALKIDRQRPLTASARVSTSSHSHHHRLHDENQIDPSDVDDDDQADVVFQYANTTTDIRNNNTSNHYSSHTYNTVHHSPHNFGSYRSDSFNNSSANGDRDVGDVENHDGASFNDNTLITEQDEFNFESPQSFTRSHYQQQQQQQQLQQQQQQDQQRQRDHQETIQYQQINQQQQQHQQHCENQNQVDSLSQAQGSSSSSLVATAEPHLSLLASQILSTVREMILSRYRTGKPLYDIFRHFDRTGKKYFDAQVLFHF